jgi:hypothetical protein
MNRASGSGKADHVPKCWLEVGLASFERSGATEDGEAILQTFMIYFSAQNQAPHVKCGEDAVVLLT